MRQDSDPSVTSQQVLDEAQQHVSLGDTYIPEVEQLLSLVSSQSKATPHARGLPAFLRKSKREHEVMKSAVAQLSSSCPSSASSASSSASESSLQTIERKVTASGTVLRHEATHWEILKRCRRLVSISQTFQGSDRDSRRLQVSQSSGNKQLLHRTLRERSRVEVDVVRGGREWVDVRWLRPDRLARQMADCGWGWGEHAVGDAVDPAEWEDIPLARQVRRLIAAARLNRHEYRVPRLRVVMPGLTRGVSGDIDALLDLLTRLDPAVEVVIEDAGGEFLRTPPPRLAVAVRRLVGGTNDVDDADADNDDDEDDDDGGITRTLNVDHTILIDLISDITHARLEPQPWQAATTRAQIVEERSSEGGVMARTLYPVLQGRGLVCTREAAEHFHEVLATVGTATERERGRLLVPSAAAAADDDDDDDDADGDDDARRQFQALSIHPLPDSLQIPVRVLSEPWTLHTVEAAVEARSLPRVALDVVRCGGFKSSKLSIYMYGWASGLTTVTSNKEVRGQIRTWVEANRRGDDELGPAILRVDATRNLLAKSATPPRGFLQES